MEKLKSHETFDPKALADLEIQAIKYEIQNNQKAKFNCEVKQIELSYGMNEVSAYHTMIARKKIENDKLIEDERRYARVEFFQLISMAGGLGFDPYEAALADEKLDVAKAEKDEKKIVMCLAEVFSIIHKKPASVFQEPSQLLVDYANETCDQLALAMMYSPSFLVGLENGARLEIEMKLDFDKLQKASLRRWESLKKAIES